MSKVMRVSFSLLLCSLIVAVPSLRASWIDDGVFLCVASNNQYDPRVTSDGAGGAIVTWRDYRSGTSYDIYAQRVDASGTVQWTADGVPLCTAAGGQNNPNVTSDGSGGTIAKWEDYRNGSHYDIYAQRVNASGTIQWSIDGVPLCSAAGDQYHSEITSDGAGGAIVTWSDLRNGSHYDIYAQRINASGTVQWTVDGVPLCTATEDQKFTHVTSDGVGGAIVTWSDLRNGSHYDIYAQRINASGTVQWTANGVPVCAATEDQYTPLVTSDGTGGAIVTWSDNRSGSHYDIYAQRIDASGTVQWTADGVPFCTAAENQYDPQVSSDGAGGAIVTWEDYRNGSHYDIYTQRIDASGTVQWTADGVPICVSTENQANPQVASDGAGGAIVTWSDYRNGSHYDIYSQRVNATGTIQWILDGIPLCTATGSQDRPQITSDGAGGVIVTWEDTRSGNSDIYAQQIDSQGRIGYLPPIIHSVSDVPGDEGGWVNLTWDAPPFDYLSGEITEYTVWRALETPAALGMLESGMAIISSPAEVMEVASMDKGLFILRLVSLNGEMFYWKLISTLTAYRLQGYSEIVPTLFDSTAVCDDYHYFQVIAHTSDPSVFYVSDPDSGYSVDNLAPCPPAMLTGEQLYSPAGLQLTWQLNTESDMDCYNVYRGLSGDFIPNPGNLLDSLCDTTSFDGDWTWSSGYYYKVSAVDIHGNESGFALLTPEDVTGTDTPEAPNAAYLRQNYPNPFNPVTTIEFGLEKPSRVSLSVYDAAGRLVRVIADEDRPSGHYSETWDGKDGSGRAVSSGVYFYRLDTGSLTWTRKMILLR